MGGLHSAWSRMQVRKTMDRRKSATDVDVAWLIRNSSHRKGVVYSEGDEASEVCKLPMREVKEEGVPLRRTKSASSAPAPTFSGSAANASNASVEGGRRGSVSKGKIGFFKSLFSHHRHEVPKPVESAPQSPELSPMQSVQSNGSSPTRRLSQPRTISNESSYAVSAENSKRLDDFIAHCKETLSERQRGIDERQRHASVGRPQSFMTPAQSAPRRLDSRGRPIPPHPSKSAFPPILKRGNCDERKLNVESTVSLSSVDGPAPETPSSATHKFGAFLKKVTSYGSQPSLNPNGTFDSIDRTVSNISDSSHRTTQDKYGTVPGLENCKQLKPVAFATTTYFNDPPQQICSKNPRKGEVEVKPNGSVIIHRLTPEERKKIMETSSAGIVVGGSGQLKVLNPIEQQSSDDEDSQKRNIAIAAEEAAAEARGNNKKEEDIEVSKLASHLTIDKPMVSRRPRENPIRTSSSSSLLSILSDEENKNGTDQSPKGSESDSGTDEEEIYPPPNLKIPHDVVYTRCCHLREILPIPATLKQIKKGSTDPIPLLQLRNPRPSLLEIWSFSDFLSISPVLCVSLDGVSLTEEMLRIILSSLVSNPHLEKLTMRNTPLNEDGWKILSYFITKQKKNFVALDLTMVPTIKTNVQKPSKSSLAKNANNPNLLKRMECNTHNRSDMNWDLLTAAVATKEGGIEEFVLAGACMSYTQFKNFIELACTNTDRLGLAYNKLTMEQCKVLAEWIVTSNIRGLDLGFNDLKGKTSVFTDAVANKVQNVGEKNEMKYISLNSTNLSVEADTTPENNEVLRLLSVLCYSENLKFLDLSNNPKIFPHCIKTLTTSLPVYVNLIRLHLDYNDLDCASIVVLAESLPLCSKLHHLSLLGSKLNLASAKALTEAVNKSNTLMTLDLEYNTVPESIKERMSLYTMRNIQNELDNVQKTKRKAGLSLPSVPQEEMAANEKQISTLQEELSSLLTDKFEDSLEYDKLVVEFIEKITKVRTKIEKVVSDLFDLRVKNELSCEGKETLINLCLIDSSFEQGIHLLKQRHNKLQKHTVAAPTSVHDEKTNLTSNKAMNKLLNNPMFSDPFANDSMSKLSNNDSDQSLERTQRDRTILSSSAFGNTGHSALLPFGTATVEESNKAADDTVEFRESENSYKTIVRGPSTDPIGTKYDILNKELEHLQKNKANKPAEKLYTLDSGVSINSDELTRAAESLESEKIKDFLLKNDVATIVNVIDELHEKGYHLHDIFRKQEVDDHKKEEILKTLQEDQSHNKSNNPFLESTGNGASAEAKKAIPKYMEEKAIDEAYDQVLDNIARIRSKTHE